MSGFEMRIDGARELDNALHQLPQIIATKYLRRATSMGAAIIRDDMKDRAPVYTGDVAQGHPPPGTLKKAIYMKQIPELSTQWQQVFFVGVRHGKKVQHSGRKHEKGLLGFFGGMTEGTNLDAYYFFMVEFGTTKMAARPFMRPAYDTKKVAAADAIIESLTDAVSAAASEVRW